MSNDSIVQVGADVRGLQQGLQQGERSLNQFGQTAEQAGKRSALALMSARDEAKNVAREAQVSVRETKKAYQEAKKAFRENANAVNKSALIQAKKAFDIANTQAALARQKAQELAREASQYERQVRSMEQRIQSIIAQRQAGEVGSSGHFAHLAMSQGLNAADLPALNTLRNLETQTNRLTISQGQYNNALHMMPAQMTDIVTQLAGGQSPFLIALQQGGQMRDMFGGFGNMFRGIAASISPFKVAMGGAVGVIGAVGYAMYSGAKEGREFENVLTLSGDRAGITADRLQAVAAQIGATTGSYGAAREAVMAFAAQGKIAQDDYGQFATSVSLMSQATGKDVADLVAEFTKIGDDPVKAVVELSGKYKSMTADVYAQVTALKEQGKEQEAVRLVQKLYADETAEMAKKVTENLGWIEKAWKGIGETASETWEKMKSLGKAQTIAQQIQELEAEKRELQSGGGEYAMFGAAADYSKQIAQIDQKISMLKQEQRAEEELTEQKRVRQLNNERDVKFLSKVGKMADDALPKMEKLNREIAEIQEGLAKFKANPENSKAAIAQAEKDAKAAIKAKQAEKNDILARERKAAEREERAATKGLGQYLAPYSGKYAITSGISAARKHPVTGKVRRHDGVDVAMPIGTQLRAMADGEITRVKYNKGGYGYYVDVRHNDGTSARYAHLSKYNVKQGQKVKAGQVIALSGNTGIGTGAHLHMEMRDKKGRLVDFRQMIGKKAMNGVGALSGIDMSHYVDSSTLYARQAKPEKTDFEKYQEQKSTQQLRAQIERELRAKGEHRVIDNERDLRSRPEFKNWTKAQQESELAKARAADELATQEKIKSLADAQIAQLTQKQALIGKNTELARLQYEMDSGSLKHLSDGQKAEILARQQAIDTAQKQYETDKKYADLLDDLATKTNEQFNQKAFELSLVGKSKAEIEKLTLAREYDLHIMQATADGASVEYIDGLRQQQIAAEEVRQKIAELKTMSDNNWLSGVQDGVTEYIGNFKTMREGIGSLVSQTANGFTDQIAEFVATGKANFREFSQSVIADISKMMIKMAIFNSLKAAGNAMSGSGGWVGAIGSMMSSAFSDGGYTGHGGKFEPAGIVHKGEYVLSQENLRALGGVSAVEGLIHRAKGYSNGGLVGGVNTVGLRAHAQASSAPVINITVNVSGSNREEARQGAEEGVQAGLRKMMSEIADSRIFEHCRPGNVIYNVAKA